MPVLRGNFRRSVVIDGAMVGEYLQTLGAGPFALYCILRYKLIDKNETSYPTVFELSKILNVSSPTLIKYSTILVSFNLLNISKDGRKNIYTINDIIEQDNDGESKELKPSPVRQLQVELYTYLDKPKSFNFAKEGGIVRRLLKKYSQDDISYTILYVKKVQKKYPTSFSWLINDSCNLVESALEQREIEEKEKERVNILAENYNTNENIDMGELKDLRENVPQSDESTDNKKNIFERLGNL